MDATTEFEIEGRRLSYPTRFRDGSATVAIFLASAEKVQRLIADTPFVVSRVLPRRAAVTINCMHYTDTDCGVYEEVAFSVFVEPYSGSARVPYLPVLRRVIGGNAATYTWRLGVSTTLSRDCGIQMWGYPKQMADLEYSTSGGTARMVWRDGGARVLSLAVPASGSGTTGPIAPPVYSLMDGVPHVGTLTQVYGGVGRHRRGVDFTLGDHPVASELRGIDLSRPLIGLWNEHIDFTMSAPARLASGVE